MPPPKLQTAYNIALRDIRVVEKYRNRSKALQPQFQGVVAEVLMLRLFSILEKTVNDMSCRIACGALYFNGVAPSPNILASSLDDALIKFKTYNRPRAFYRLQFTNVSNTNDAIKEVIPPIEPFCQNLSHYGNEFEEMRNVRNQIAHRTSSTYAKFKNVISRKYGAALRLKTSSFLISTTRERIPMLDQYVTIVKLMIHDLAKGY